MLYRRLHSAVLPALAAILLMPPCASATEAWKWTDEHGGVHYTDKPTVEGAVPVEIQAPAPRIDPGMEERRQKRRRLLEIFDEDRQRRRQQEEAARQAREERRQRCTAARRHLRNTLNASFLYEKTDDPYNPRILSEEERKAKTKRLRNRVDSLCR